MGKSKINYKIKKKNKIKLKEYLIKIKANEINARHNTGSSSK